MSAEPRWAFTTHDSGEALAHALADAVAGALQSTVEARGSASLAVSGGRTPTRFFQALRAQDVPWQAVTVLLVDERWVPEDHAASNSALVKQTLLQDRAAAANWLALTTDAARPEDGVDAVCARLTASGCAPIDALVLGMGGDGHTASLFPDAPELPALLASDAPVGAANPASQPQARITLTPAWINAARNRWLHIEGADKRRVFDQATGDGPVEALPIRSALRAAAPSPLQVVWAP